MLCHELPSRGERGRAMLLLMRTEIDTSSPTREVRAQYRQAYAQFRYSLYDLTEHPAVGDAVAVHEDRRLVELAEIAVLRSAPLAPHVDPSWPGGWVQAQYMLRAPIPAPSQPHPPVWRRWEDALAAIGEGWEVVWTPVCRQDQGDQVWMLLDDLFWRQGVEDVLVSGPAF